MAVNDNRQESILQMMEVTNCDENIALEYLLRTDFDVEIALRHFFEETLPEPTLNNSNSPAFSNSSNQELSDTAQPNQENKPSVVSREVVPKYHSFLQFIAQLITFPVRFPLYVLNIVCNYFFEKQKLIYAHIFEYISQEFPQFESIKSDVFYGERLQNLRNDLQRNNWKWLVAYIHDPDGDLTFFKSLFNSGFSEQIRSHNGILFGCVSGSEDAKRLKPDRSYGKSQKSCVIIFVINRNALTRKLIVNDLSNPDVVNVNIEMALVDLISAQADHEAQERSINESRKLMEEQNREYQKSLQQDLDRIAREKTEKEEADLIRKEKQKQQLESEDRLKKVQDYKNELLQHDFSSEGPHDLLIRFPTGKKIIKFSDEEGIEKIFVEAMKSELCPLFFQMHQNFPRKAVPCLPKWYYEILEKEELEPKEECLSMNLTFQQAGITRGSMVYVDNL